jgi:hypothetical protein
MAELADALDLGSDLPGRAKKRIEVQNAVTPSIYNGFGGSALGTVRHQKAPKSKTKCHHMCHRNALDFFAFGCPPEMAVYATGVFPPHAQPTQD